MEKALLLLFVALFTKHLIVDWLWQTDFEVANKGTFGHIGGIQHSLKHAVATALVLLFFPITAKYVAIVMLGEFVVHYAIDWSKMNLNKKYGWTPKDKAFWYAIGVDQFAHYLTYAAIVWYVT